jgi:hypothetical protein
MMTQALMELEVDQRLVADGYQRTLERRASGTAAAVALSYGFAHRPGNDAIPPLPYFTLTTLFLSARARRMQASQLAPEVVLSPVSKSPGGGGRNLNRGLSQFITPA